MCSSRWGTFLNMYWAGNSNSSRLSRSSSCLRRKSYQRRGSPVGTLNIRSMAPKLLISSGVRVTAADPTGGSDASSDCGTSPPGPSYDQCPGASGGRGCGMDRRYDEDPQVAEVGERGDRARTDAPPGARGDGGR